MSAVRSRQRAPNQENHLASESALPQKAFCVSAGVSRDSSPETSRGHAQHGQSGAVLGSNDEVGCFDETSRRRLQHFDPEGPDRVVEMVRKDAVAVVQQEFVSLFVPNHLAQLLQRPGGAWTRGDVAVDQPAIAMLDHHKNIQQTKGRRDGDEEVTGDDSLSMQAQGTGPTQIASWSTVRPLRQVLVHRPGRHRIPIFSSNSLAMRPSPHEGFSFAIRRINACSPPGIGGRPERLGDQPHQYLSLSEYSALWHNSRGRSSRSVACPVPTYCGGQYVRAATLMRRVLKCVRFYVRALYANDSVRRTSSATCENACAARVNVVAYVELVERSVHEILVSRWGTLPYTARL
jgi:hypothetical protein